MFFSDDGSTSVEVALKIAYQYWINVGEPRRRVLVGFDGGYHGDTLGAMSLGRGSQMFSPFRELMCKVYVLPYPSTFEGDDAADEREAGALSAFEALLADRGQTIAALIIEPSAARRRRHAALPAELPPTPDRARAQGRRARHLR